MSGAREPLPPHALAKLLASARAAAPEQAEPSSAAPRLGRYRLGRELGRGGMGIVYAAIDEELGREVALKVLSLPPGANEELRRRFVFEAQACARLNHPNIAAIYEASDELIAMQLIDGPPLSAHRGESPRRIARWIADAARAVQVAHEHGIVHRDLKPQNLLLEGERIFVTDFGLAKALDIEDPISRSGHLLGTPAYMAPEQAQGAAHLVDARTDVWGLGATLFDLLAGRPPFAERDALALLRRLAHDEPPRLRSVCRSAPRELDLIVARCLQRESAQRYPSALALAEDLERWLEGRPVQARPPGFAYRAQKLLARHPRTAALATSALLALLVVGLLAWSERRARGASDAALALSSRVEAALADAEMLRRLGASEEEARARLEDGLRACEEFLRAHVAPQAQHLRGRLLAASARSAEAESCFELALTGDPALVEARFELCCSRARTLFAQSAASERWSGLEIEEELAPELRATRRSLLRDLAQVVAESVRLRRPDAAYARALQAWLAGDRASARRELGEAQRFDPTHREAALALSRLELAEGQGDAAWALAMQAIDLQRGFAPAYLARSTRIDPVERALRQIELSAADQRVESGDASAEALRERGAARLRLFDVEGALADLERVISEHPSDAAAYAHLGLVHARQAASRGSDAHAAALSDWERSREALDRSLVLDPALVEAWNNRGVAELERARRLEAIGRGSEADAARQRAEADFARAIELQPSSLLALLNRARGSQRRAEDAATAKRWDEAELHAAEAERDLSAAASAHPRDLEAQLAAAELASLRATIATQRHRERALRAHDRAVELAPKDPLPRGLRGLFHARIGEIAAARADLEAALALRPAERWRALLERELEALR
ncbi:MAG: tetratricopeptide repeat protein [Planctomycetes bacterium]|nr:tetratricopeptide repeat protein [Planctomycetota bacterium]